MDRQCKDNLPLISVIVPIYQVEKYLRKCIDSIINQTYTNLEIILVDDGSQDGCRDICDYYATQDSRIKVIHQSNQGLSEARNHGLDISTGEYIGFVDGDDCVHPEMYQRLYDDICRYKTKLAFCRTVRYVWPNEQIKIPNERTECLSAKEVMTESLSKSIWWSAYTKLYHRSLFDGVRYPRGLYEDYHVSIRIYSKCDYIAVNHNGLYNYCSRAGSITHSKFSNEIFSQIETSRDVLQYVKSNCPEFTDYAENIYVSTVIRILNHILLDKGGTWRNRRDEMFGLLDERFRSSIVNPKIIRAHKVFLLLAHCNRLAYRECLVLYTKIKRISKR
jgi:glycosyltransferase involved in cell wall biosynthesis